jgi:oxygen-independent coproporphyrinogen-3 oxidase
VRLAGQYGQSVGENFAANFGFAHGRAKVTELRDARWSYRREMRDDSVGVYVHVPFCGRVCPYCDFAVVAVGSLDAGVESRYVDALVRELDARAGEYDGLSLASLYLGGGTPALLTPASVARIGAAVRGAFGAGRSPEVTLEVNPSTLERSRLDAFREAGVGRVSVGVQSFDDVMLRRLGRAHKADAAVATLDACRAAGFDSLSIDLIFAGPGQTEASLERDLARALAFEPEHLSTYELTIESKTPFALAHSRGQLDLPSEDGSLEMMSHIEARLTAAGLARYEISNYARPGFEAVHNRRYWERRCVLGLGMGAFSTLPASPSAPHGRRRSNSRKLATYLERIESGCSGAVEADEVFDAPTARGEAVFLALRGAGGLDAGEFEAEFGESPRAFFGAGIDKLVALGLLDESATGGLRLTGHGRALADTVFAEFVA